MPMENIESVEAPASSPDEDVISPREHPQDWEVGVGEDTGAVGEVAQALELG
jgi:hypothetical protein